MAPNILIRTAQAVLAVSAAFLVADSILPGHTVSGWPHWAAWLAGCSIGLLPVGLEHLRTQWATRQRRRAAFRQRHGAKAVQ